MPCYKPNLAFQHKTVKQKLRFTPAKHYRDKNGFDPYNSEFYNSLTDKEQWRPVALPCGQCIWCRLQNSKEKAIRAIHESKQYEQNCFLTLTYNDKTVPKDKYGNLVYELSHIQNFMKRLRFHSPNLRIKSFGCAEYGERFSRPHFHLCLFNYDFKDKKFWRYSQNDWSNDQWPVHRSQFLEELWPHGYSEIGTLTEESASYVARYITKKITGEQKTEHYKGRPPERIVCNSKGIGLNHLIKYHDEILANDAVIYKGKQEKIPRYYQKKLELLYPERYITLRNQRITKIRECDLDGTKLRLSTREKVHVLKSKRLIRSYEK